MDPNQLEFQFVFRDERGDLRPERPGSPPEGRLWAQLAAHLEPICHRIERDLRGGAKLTAERRLMALTDAILTVYDTFDVDAQAGR